MDRNKLTKRHEHFFGSQADEENDRNRFDAVEDEEGICWLFDVEAKIWTQVRDYDYACKLAKMCAAGTTFEPTTER